MFRWIRVAATGVVVLSLVLVGIGLGLFLATNDEWVAVQVPKTLSRLVPDLEWEVWLPALFAGCLVSVVAIALLLVALFYFMSRKRHDRSLVQRLERELVSLRNMPVMSPAPLEDLPESPDPAIGRLLVEASDRIDWSQQGRD